MKAIDNYTPDSPLNCFQTLSDKCEVQIHLHDIYEIYQAISPNIRYFVEGHSYRMKPGDLVITSTSEIHRPMTVDENPYERRIIQFKPSLINTYNDLDYNPLDIFTDRTSGTSNIISLSDEDKHMFDCSYHDMARLISEGSDKNLYKSRLILTDLLVMIEGLYKQTSTKSATITVDPRIEKVIAHLDNHFVKSFNLDGLAKTFIMDKYYLSHLFKENTGFTLMDYIQSKRIQLAKSLMAKVANDHEAHLSINEIANECGYEDYSNFFKTFKKLVNQSPKQYMSSLSS